VFDTAGNFVPGTASVTGGIWTLDMDLSSLQDGTLYVEAVQTDLGGNTEDISVFITLDTTTSVSIDTPIADDNIVNRSEMSAVVFTGTGEPGATVSVSSTDGTSNAGPVSANVGSDGSWSATLDLTGFSGPSTVTAISTDTVLNQDTQSAGFTVASTLPSVSISNVDSGADSIINSSEEDSVTVTGSSDQSSVVVTLIDSLGNEVSQTLGPVVSFVTVVLSEFVFPAISTTSAVTVKAPSSND
jgi:hypothetical protein